MCTDTGFVTDNLIGNLTLDIMFLYKFRLNLSLICLTSFHIR